jgi:hypothetical protein
MSKYFKKDTTKGVIEPVKQNIIKGILDRREKEKKKLPRGLQIDTTTGEEANITKLAKGGRVRDKQPPKTKKYFRSTKSGAGMTKAGVARYRRENPGSKLKTAVTGKVKKGSKAANRRKSYCARSAGQMKKFPKAAADPNSRLRQARRRWKC